MRAGDLNRRVRIRPWQDTPAISFGVTQNFDEGHTVWANIRPVGSAVFYGTKQLATDVTHNITVRRNSVLNELTVTALHVVEHMHIRYRVKRAMNVDDADTWLQIDCEQLGVIP